VLLCPSLERGEDNVDGHCELVGWLEA
jgi:hypothetical protein